MSLYNRQTLGQFFEPLYNLIVLGMRAWPLSDVTYSKIPWIVAKRYWLGAWRRAGQTLTKSIYNHWPDEYDF